MFCQHINMQENVYLLTCYIVLLESYSKKGFLERLPNCYSCAVYRDVDKGNNFQVETGRVSQLGECKAFLSLTKLNSLGFFVHYMYLWHKVLNSHLLTLSKIIASLQSGDVILEAKGMRRWTLGNGTSMLVREVYLMQALACPLLSVLPTFLGKYILALFL